MIKKLLTPVRAPSQTVVDYRVSAHTIKYSTLFVTFVLTQIGRFFGEIDGSIMASLIKMGMFQQYD